MVMETTDFFFYTQIKNWRYMKPSKYCGWKTWIYRDDSRCLKICSYISCSWQGIAISRINLPGFSIFEDIIYCLVLWTTRCNWIYF